MLRWLPMRSAFLLQSERRGKLRLLGYCPPVGVRRLRPDWLDVQLVLTPVIRRRGADRRSGSDATRTSSTHGKSLLFFSVDHFASLLHLQLCVRRH